MSTIGVSLSDNMFRRHVFRRSPPPPPPPPPTSPLPNIALSNRSSGWTAGDNPPSWVWTDTGDGILYDPDTLTGDKRQAEWTFRGGAPVLENPTPFDADYILADPGFAWPLLTAADLTLGGAFTVRERAIRDHGLPTEAIGAWSNTWTDTLTAAPAAATWTAVTPAQIKNNGYADNVETFDFAMSAGENLIIVSTTTASTVTGVSVAGEGAATLVAQKSTALPHLSIWRRNCATAGAKTVTVTGSGALQYVAAAVGALSGANLTPAQIVNASPPDGSDPKSLGTELTIGAGAIGIVFAAHYTGGPCTWANATEETDISLDATFAQTTARVTTTGTPTVTGGQFAPSAMLAVVFNPA